MCQWRPLNLFFNEGLIEVDEDNIDDYDCILVRATQKGLDEFNQQNPQTEQKGEVKMTTEFVIETGIAIPKSTRKNAVTKYPFADMPEGSSFLVPGDNPKLLSRMNAAVAKANVVFSEETDETKVTRKGNIVPVRKAVRKFKAASVEGGVRVFRVL